MTLVGPMTRRLPWSVALLAVLVLGAGCGHSGAPAAATSPTSASGVAAKQQYLDAVNALCDKLLPEVVSATHGGSIDIPAAQYLRDWPAHNALLVSFDKSLATVPVPAAAAPAAAAMRSYIAYADSLDAARLKAARAGESAWRREVAAETGAASDPSIAARNAAGFAASCDAR